MEPSLTPADLVAMQDRLGITNREFAAFLTITPRTLLRCKAGDCEIPYWIAKFGPLLIELADGAWGPHLERRMIDAHEKFLAEHGSRYVGEDV